MSVNTVRRVQFWWSQKFLESKSHDSCYRVRFGLYEVDYESPERTRTPRTSAFVYKQIVKTKELDLSYEPDTTTMSIDEGH